jgi:hypothetical protein
VILSWPVGAHHIVLRNACKSAKTPLRGINAFLAGLGFMSPLQGALRTSALVMAVAFPHHAVQEKAAPVALSEIAGRDARKA